MLTCYGTILKSRFLLGTAQYPSPAVLIEAMRSAQAGAMTVSLRRESANGSGGKFVELIRGLNLPVLPNTAGCSTVREAVTTAQMARELFQTSWIKLEVIGHMDTLQPDVFALVEAARILTDEGFQVFPYCTEDLVVAEKLLEAGCEVLMPWGAPIGSGMGIKNESGLRSLRAYFPDTVLILDAGIGLPSHAAKAMEMGFDAILLNTAVARAGNPVKMAGAMRDAILAGRAAFEADPMEPTNFAQPSTPVLGQAFLN